MSAEGEPLPEKVRRASCSTEERLSPLSVVLSSREFSIARTNERESRMKNYLRPIHTAGAIVVVRLHVKSSGNILRRPYCLCKSLPQLC